VLRAEPLSLCGLRLLSSLCDDLLRVAELVFDESPFSCGDREPLVNCLSV
jgi:hypothetical protein